MTRQEITTAKENQTEVTAIIKRNRVFEVKGIIIRISNMRDTCTISEGVSEYVVDFIDVKGLE